MVVVLAVVAADGSFCPTDGVDDVDPVRLTGTSEVDVALFVSRHSDRISWFTSAVLGNFGVCGAVELLTGGVPSTPPVDPSSDPMISG